MKAKVILEDAMSLTLHVGEPHGGHLDVGCPFSVLSMSGGIDVGAEHWRMPREHRVGSRVHWEVKSFLNWRTQQILGGK